MVADFLDSHGCVLHLELPGDDEFSSNGYPRRVGQIQTVRVAHRLYRRNSVEFLLLARLHFPERYTLTGS